MHGQRQDARVRAAVGGDPRARVQGAGVPQTSRRRGRRLPHARAREADLRRRRALHGDARRHGTAHAPRGRHRRQRGRPSVRISRGGCSHRHPRPARRRHAPLRRVRSQAMRTPGPRRSRQAPQHGVRPGDQRHHRQAAQATKNRPVQRDADG